MQFDLSINLDVAEQNVQEAINAAYGCDFCDLEPMAWVPRLGEDNLNRIGRGAVDATDFRNRPDL